MGQNKARNRLKWLRSLAAYARYRYERDGPGSAESDMVTLLWAIAVIEETRASMAAEEWDALLRRASGRKVRLETPRNYVRRQVEHA